MSEPSDSVGTSRRIKGDATRATLLFLVKTIHSGAFLIIQTAIVYLLYKGIRKESDRSAALAASIAVGESLIYAGNGFRCPLRTLAEDLGEERGSVTDIFLPKWLADNVARIYTPILTMALYLHVRNILGRRAMDQSTG